jgi:hypothetical protein
MDIPRTDWPRFLDSLNRLHEGEPINVEVLRLDIGAQLEIARQPLRGISAEVKGGRCTILIAAGQRPLDHVAHLISDPVLLRVVRGSTGDDEALEIETADSTKTIVSFQGPRGWSGQRPSA